MAVLTYQFFTGRTPTTGGIDYLVSPTGPDPDNLNSAYYQGFNVENRYINFAVNLGRYGEGAAAFQAAHGAESLFDATRDAYAAIFGATPTDAKLHDILDTTLTLNGATFTRAQYFALYGGDGPSGLGTKAAAVGFLLAEAEKADVGVYAHAQDSFLSDLVRPRARSAPGAWSSHLLCADQLAARGLERGLLKAEVLVGRADAGVAVQRPRQRPIRLAAV